MSKISIVEEVSAPTTPPAGRMVIWSEAGTPHFMASDGVDHPITDATAAVQAHLDAPDPHTQYMTELEADAAYAEIAHIHATANLLNVCKSGTPGTFATVALALAAIGTGSYAAASASNRYVIKVGPGEFTEAPGLTIPAYVYVSGNDPWNSAVLKTSDLTADFITVSPNGGMFNIAVSGPTTATKSAIKQVASGTIKLYWVNIKEGSYGVTLAPTSGTARCHCIGVVTDGPTVMNRMFNCDNPGGVGVFILMQSGPMSTTWTGTQPTAVYVNGNGTLGKANATLDLCQFRGTGHDAVYADNAAVVRGICCSFALGATAVHVGPNGGSKVDIHGSQIKPDGWTKDIWVESATALVSFSGVATESKLTIASGATFVGSFADTATAMAGQVIYGELWIGNTSVKTPLASYIQADKNTGLVSGGGLSRGAGAREVDVAAGVAFIDTATGLKKVSWNATTLTIAANSAEARIFVDSAGIVQYQLTSLNKELYCLLGEAGTSASAVTYLFDNNITLPQFRPRLYSWMEHVIGPINTAGGLVTPDGLGMDVSASTYYLTEAESATADVAGISFNYWYRDGSGGWTVSTATTLNATQYDDGTGTLATMTASYWRRDTLYVSKLSTGATEFNVFMGQEEFATEIEADVNPIAADPVSEHACRLAALVIQKSASTFTAIDQRPRLGQMAAGSSGITNHNDLAGRDNTTAHTQYQLITEKGVADGYASLDGTGKLTAGELPTIAHGNQAGGTLHSIATTSVAGFMSAADKVKSDSVASGATANSSDATLLNRANHTGAQAISTVTGLQTALDSKITGSRQTCIKTSDQSMSSTTPVDVTEMSVTLEASSRYTFKFMIPYRSAATGTGISFAVNGPATPTVLAYMKTAPTSATAVAVSTANTYSVHQPTATTTAANADQYATLEGVIVTGAAGGAFTLQFSSESNGQAVTVRQGATGYVEKM